MMVVFFHRVHIERLGLRDFSAVLVQPPVQRKTRLNMENLFIHGFIDLTLIYVRA